MNYKIITDLDDTIGTYRLEAITIMGSKLKKIFGQPAQMGSRKTWGFIFDDGVVGTITSYMHERIGPFAYTKHDYWNIGGCAGTDVVERIKELLK